MVDKDNWEENKDEAKELAQEFIYDEKRKSECIKYFISHFKISQATAYRWYDKIYNELSIPSIDKANKLAEFKAQVEHQIETSMKDIEKLPVNEKIKLFSEITKLKKELRKL
jgi:polyhydroxyalkanoate synthesis regulator phasin